MVYIGIDVGGTGLKAGVVDESGKILYKVSCPTDTAKGAEAMIKDMADLAIKAIEESGVSMDDVKSIGLGIPGIEDPRTERVPAAVNLGWTDVPLREIMRSFIDKPIFVGNDATVAGLAESVAGASAGAENSVFVTLGTGVGGGIVIGGKVYSGSNGVGSEIGHMITVAGGEKCNCGGRGCWERYASASAIIRWGVEKAKANPDGALNKACGGDTDKITAKTVLDLAKEGDADCMEIFDTYVYHLCAGLVNIVNLYDPEVIVLGGGVSGAGSFLLDAVRAKLPEFILFKAMPFARVELATLGNDAGIIGAAMLGK